MQASLIARSVSFLHPGGANPKLTIQALVGPLESAVLEARGGALPGARVARRPLCPAGVSRRASTPPALPWSCRPAKLVRRYAIRRALPKRRLRLRHGSVGYFEKGASYLLIFEKRGLMAVLVTRGTEMGLSTQGLT
jgi:hypothetical protein